MLRGVITGRRGVLQEARPSITELSQMLANAMWPLAGQEQDLALTAYRQLATGAPVSARTLATALSRDEREIAEALDRWTGVFRDDDGAIISFWGLALPQMANRIRIDDRTLHAWCAWDTLFIPELIGQRVQVESQSPVSGEPVHLTVAPSRVEEVVPEETVVSMLAPDADFDDTVVLRFCHFVHFFTSAQDARPWLAAHPKTFLLSVSEAFELGQQVVAAKFPALSSDGHAPERRRDA